MKLKVMDNLFHFRRSYQIFPGEYRSFWFV